ncbi:MAG: ATP-dependent Clp protease ATP-binding subunit [Candidatus Curtissbacteria bacterium]|nr:ATP-dependent Clp protease ATP-binding subunit [Candidatus Curtissbacteria bacterium]
MDLPANYFSYHFSYALPNFIKTRPAHLASVAEFFNIASLTKNLFSPYRRMTSTTQKTTLTDRISFNLISRGIGAIIRLIFIAIGIFAIAIFFIYEIVASLLYILPIFSLPGYLKLKSERVLETDLQNSQKIIEKLKKSSFFETIVLFFDENFKKILESPPPQEIVSALKKSSVENVMLYLSKSWPNLKSYLESINVNEQEFTTLATYIDKLQKTHEHAKPAPIGQLLSYGYTNTLDKYGTELTNKYFPHLDPKVEIIDQIVKIINRPQNNNVLLIGEVGVGRHSVVETLASQIKRQQIPSLKGKRIILLDTIALLGSTQNMVDIKSNFENVLTEAKNAGNVILAINQIDRVASPLEERIDLTEVVTTVLTDNSLPIIGIATPEDFNQFIRPNGAILKLFEKIDIEEPEKENVESILIGKAMDFYKQHNVATTLPAILEIIEKSASLVQDTYQPEKSIVILQDAIALAKETKKKQVDVETVDKIISAKTKIPLGKITEGETEKLKDLEGFLHKRIVGQNEAISVIAKAMRRARTGIEKDHKTIGSFLFLGPTGVGKTETAKALAETYFGKESKMIRLDMTEFGQMDSVNRLIGDVPTKTQGQLTSLVHQNPFGLLLLDEFEKASREIQNLFLQILDEGKLTDAFEKKTSFENIIVIATSNAAAEFIREEISKGLSEGLSEKLIDYILSQGMFSPELINRFDAVVVYHPLTPKEVEQVSKLMLTKLAMEVKDNKNITLEITDELAKVVAQKGYNPEFGARPINRLIQDKIEDGIAKMLIAGTIKNGDKIPAVTLLGFL